MDQQKINLGSIKNVPEASWQKLAAKRIFFGHQSVGYNILDGIKDLEKENPQIKLEAVEVKGISEIDRPMLAHSKVGKNTDPASKLEEFAGFVKSGADRLDIAFLKFCYVDVKGETDVEKVFSGYKTAFEALKRDCPRVKFIHMTVPLEKSWGTWKTTLKRLLGKKDIWEYKDNVARNRFNQLLLKEYAGKEPVFDLAAIESSYPDGTRSFFEQAGVAYFSMVPDYTKDGGHLNEVGRKRVAEQLLITLVDAVRD
jgi:hypothetical protein